MEQKIIKGYIIKGFKLLNGEHCRNFKYEIGESYEIEESPICKVSGFHFWDKVIDCFNIHGFSNNTKIIEVEVYGDIDRYKGFACTNKIRLVKELTWNEVLDLCNSGCDNTGYGNSGICNSGNNNSGYANSGNNNSGYANSGNYNSGSYNSGSRNSGDGNSNYGNTGNWNSGHNNSGNYNLGDWNSGIRNSGYNNSGDTNSGDYNSGKNNYGSYNTGNHNLGNHNSGDWNLTDRSTGIFNTKTTKIVMFNKLSDWDINMWNTSKAKIILDDMPVDSIKWVADWEMNDNEKKNHPTYKVTEGYLKSVDMSNRQEWWHKLNQNDKNEILSMPNFDKEIFKEITGIDVDL